MPEIFGRYNLIEVLGEESAATLYKANDTDQDREVLIKILQTHSFSLENMQLARQRFEHVINPITRLSHPNIITIQDHGELRGKPFMVTPWLEGCSLQQKLKERLQLPWYEALPLVLKIANTLTYAHTQGVFHQDIKPANIFLTTENEPILQNFCSTELWGDESTLNSSEVIFGTPAYLAPELAVTKTADAPSEVYALGIVLYEMIAGRTPYQTVSPIAMQALHANEPLPRLSLFVNELPDDLVKTIYKALEKNPADRFQSMQEFADTLAGIPVTMPPEINEPTSTAQLLEKLLPPIPVEVSTSQPSHTEPELVDEAQTVEFTRPISVESQTGSTAKQESDIQYEEFTRPLPVEKADAASQEQEHTPSAMMPIEDFTLPLPVAAAEFTEVMLPTLPNKVVSESVSLIPPLPVPHYKETGSNYNWEEEPEYPQPRIRNSNTQAKWLLAELLTIIVLLLIILLSGN